MKRIVTACAIACALPLASGAHPAAADSAGTGLSSSQTAQLHGLGFAVVPEPVPPGFVIASVSVDTKARTYAITYKRAKDGATMTFAGGAAGTAPKKHRGFFSSIGQTIGNIGKKSSETQEAMSTQNSEATTPVTEAENSAVAADNPLAGPIHFESSKGCISGSPDPKKAVITDAHFTVSACNLKVPDPLIHAYKSLARI